MEKADRTQTRSAKSGTKWIPNQVNSATSGVKQGNHYSATARNSTNHRQVGASSEPRQGCSGGIHRREASDPGCLKAGAFFSGELAKPLPASKTSPPYLFSGAPKNLAEVKGNILTNNGATATAASLPAKLVDSTKSSLNCSQNLAVGSTSLRFSGEAAVNGAKSGNVSPLRTSKAKEATNNVLNNSRNLKKVDASCGNILRSSSNSAKANKATTMSSELGGTNGRTNRSGPAPKKGLGGVPSLAIGPEEMKNAGNEWYRNGKFNEALALYDRAIALSPLNASYHSNKAAALVGLGRLAEAVSECEEAVKLDPVYIRAHQRLASLYLRLGLVESAKRHCKAIVMSEKDCPEMQRIQIIEKHISKCIEARKCGDWKAVIKESDAAVVSGADSAPQLFSYKAEALLKLHKAEEADKVLSAAERVESTLTKLGVTSEDSLLLVTRAQIDMDIGRFESAVVAAESAARVDPRSVEVLSLLRKARVASRARADGNRLFKAGRFYEACLAYGEGLECHSLNPVLLCNRAACRSKLKQWEKAVEDCDAALNAQPNYTKALLRRANCHAMLERWEDAIRDYEEVSRDVPEDLEVARGLFEARVALKKSKGEDFLYTMKFGGDVEEVLSNNHFKEAIASPGLAVVEFNTRWSPKCKEISPFVDQLCKRFPSVNFLKVDVDDNPCLAKTENVSFVPTFKLYKNGEKLKEILGPTQQALEYAVKHYIF